MTPNPIHKVLSTLRTHGVRHLLMGGQACVFYGAAEFSRDTDIVLLAEQENLDRLKAALADLQAACIAVPPFSIENLLKGHAVHFRCRHPEAVGMRLDVMAVLRGVEPFPILWQRRTTVEVGEEGTYELLSLPDLVQAKKTQRDKDWIMLRRLLETHHVQNAASPTMEQIRFWLLEDRTPSLLIEAARRHPALCDQLIPKRSLLAHAGRGEESRLASGLKEEEEAVRDRDRLYWLPLKRELEELRRGVGRQEKESL